MTTTLARHGRLLSGAAAPLLLFLLFLLVASPALAVDVTSHPGYVDGSLLKAYADEDGELVEVTLDGEILKMFAGPASAIEETVGDIVSRLVSIRALVVELRDDSGREAAESIEEIRDRLTRDGWQQIARVRDGDARVNVLFKTTDDVIHGVTVLVVDGNELVFTNLAGELRSEDLEKLSAQFQVPGMHALGEATDHDHDE